MGNSQSAVGAFGSCPVSGAQLYTAANGRVFSQLPCGTDYPFNDISSLTKTVTGLAQCADHCATVAGCRQAVWVTTNNVCWPKTVARTTGGNTAITAARAINLYATAPVTSTTTARPTSTTVVTSTSVRTTTTTVTDTVAAPPTSAPTAIAGYSQVFLDDFTGASGAGVDTSKWIYDVGTQYQGGGATGPAQWGTGEIETYTNSNQNVLLSGSGSLMLVPRNTNGQWTSGRIETQRKDFMAPAGKKMKIQAQIRLPAITTNNGLGYWAAFWTLGGAYRNNYQNWPHIGEFDILENVNGNGNVYGGLHCGQNPGGVCNEPSGLNAARACPGSSCQGNWHTYTLDVDRSSAPERLTWSVDGSTTYSITQTALGNDTAWNEIVHAGHFILLNVAMGGGFPNALSNGVYTPTANTVSGAEMRVDYVGVWYSN